MKIVLVILISALILKDTSRLNDPYIMRGIAQGLCLLVGGVWFLRYLSFSLMRRYWPILGYIVTLSLATIGTAEPVYVSFQVISLVAVIVFFIAYYESHKGGADDPNAILFNTTIILFTFVTIISLVLIVYSPSVAYETIHKGHIRFRGVFSKSAMVGSASGLLVGLSWFGMKRWWLKLIPVMAGSACMALALSRTPWIATIIAGGLTTWLYSQGGKKQILTTIVASVLTLATISAFDIQVDTKEAEKTVRIESVTNLSGRIGLWETGLENFGTHPILGYGFTMGSLGVKTQTGGLDNASSGLENSRAVGKATLHSGYLQSLLDSGLLGTFFYLSTMALAVKKLYLLDTDRAFPAAFFALIFLLAENVAENVIYSASVFDSVLFWGIAVFALSLSENNQSLTEHRF